jgi:hypothetical protein
MVLVYRDVLFVTVASSSITSGLAPLATTAIKYNLLMSPGFLVAMSSQELILAEVQGRRQS